MILNGVLVIKRSILVCRCTASFRPTYAWQVHFLQGCLNYWLGYRKRMEPRSVRLLQQENHEDRHAMMRSAFGFASNSGQTRTSSLFNYGIFEIGENKLAVSIKHGAWYIMQRDY